VPDGSLIFFPFNSNYLFCGLLGILEYKTNNKKDDINAYKSNIKHIREIWLKIIPYRLKPLTKGEISAYEYLRDEESLNELKDSIAALKDLKIFEYIFKDMESQKAIKNQIQDIHSFLAEEDEILDQSGFKIASSDLELINTRLILIRDCVWWLEKELLLNMEKVRSLIDPLFENDVNKVSAKLIHEMAKVNLILNNLDRLEIRGRDSAGISVMIRFPDKEALRAWEDIIQEEGLFEEYNNRKTKEDLVHKSIKAGPPTLFFIFKTARELGHLGDNVLFLRKEISEDRLFRMALSHPDIFSQIIAHTRWASVGDITEANCHPLDNRTSLDESMGAQINVVLNGDIDNYRDLKQRIEEEDGIRIPSHITTDTKIIPLWVEHYLRKGLSLKEAFRLAVSDFEGSHAIALQSDKEPDHIYLAQRGSGQAIFIGIAHDCYIAASEVYGLVEQIPFYIKLDGEKERIPGRSETRGQIFMLDTKGGLEGLSAWFYDGHPLSINESFIKAAQITTRDIDRQGFPHFFLKEISQAPESIRKTIRGRATIIKKEGERRVRFNLGEEILPDIIINALKAHKIKNIYLMGQGTAGVAAQGIAMLMSEYLARTSISVCATKASELSGFGLDRSMSDTLVLAVTQSGTTTDTNKAVDLVRNRGAFTMAIVNRRDSDITTKVDGILYTSDGRDIEMSVASTKAFYSQIAAGCILGLRIAQILGTKSEGYIVSEIRDLMNLPNLMAKIIDEQKDTIKSTARSTALPKRNWSVVGSGPNKVAADEIRIKLSELCYKTLPADVVEDRKHIDLSAEPLIVVCAAGNRETVLGDVIKDTAIFKAHQATVVCIATEGEERFAGLADALFYVPDTNERFSPILNTLAGHLWGYYVAGAMNEEADFFKEFKIQLNKRIEILTGLGDEGPEMIYDREIRLTLKEFERSVMQRKQEGRFDSIVRPQTLCNLALASRYAMGQIPVNEMVNHFGAMASHGDPLILLCQVVDEVIDQLSRPIDAIKHQAKTVTVGTSRLPVTLTGAIFNIIPKMGFCPSDLGPQIISRLKQIQPAVAEVKGATLYHITGLDPFGTPTPNSQIRIIERYGATKNIPSRVNNDPTLRGTKRRVVKVGEVYVGLGLWDKAQIIIFPLIGKEEGEEYLLVLHVTFFQDLILDKKIRAMGMKYNDVIDIVTEWNIPWQDNLIDGFSPEFLMTEPEGVIAQRIVEAV
jgi:glucosamine--fructose-6-phosphate aminotransferase (isomerizing)